MTMKLTMLRAAVAGMTCLAAVAAVGSGGSPGVAAAAFSCVRTVAIDPQVTASESSRSLTFVVHTGGCGAAGEVSFEVSDGSATRPRDYTLSGGSVSWATNDMSSKSITATINHDTEPEAVFDLFRVTLTTATPSSSIRIVARYGLARIFDNDGKPPLATLDSRICLVTRQACADGSQPGQLGVWTIEPGHIIQVPLVLNTANSTNQTADFETEDGSLEAGEHYEHVDLTVNIPAGALVVFVPVKMLPAAYLINGGYLNVHLSNYTGGGVMSGSGQITVWN